MIYFIAYSIASDFIHFITIYDD